MAPAARLPRHLTTNIKEKVMRSPGRFQALRSIAAKRRDARALHDAARRIALRPGRERDANVVSKEAAMLDAEVDQMLAKLMLAN